MYLCEYPFLHQMFARTVMKNRDVVPIQTDKDEINRLRGELDSCHKAYLAQTEKLQGLRQDISKLSMELALNNQDMAEELAKQTVLIEKLHQDLARQAPRIEAARDFFVRMAEADAANHKTASN